MTPAIEALSGFVAPSSSGKPASPVAGQIHYDTATGILYWYNGSTWVEATGAGGGALQDYKDSVRAATTANITISTALNNADTLDGVTLATGDRVLVKNQTTTKENGIYIVGVSPARSTDADGVGELSGGTTVHVEEGTQNADQIFSILTNGAITPGTTSHDWGSTSTPVAVTFLGEWANFEAAGTFQTVTYRKSFDGKVHLRGVAKRKAGGANKIFTLPAGFRPSKTEVFIIQTSGGAARFDISAAGDVSPAITEAGAFEFVSLSGISFYAD